MELSSLAVAIRRAGPDDVKAIEALEVHSFATDRLSPRSLRDYLRSPRASVVVAETEDGRIVGYALVRFRRATSIARLYSIAVAEEARGHGIGERLITAAEDEARARGDLFMRLEVRTDNIPAIALYHRLGYRVFSRHLDYYEDHAAAMRLEKRIIGRAPPNARDVPYYAQTTEFTCGPAAMMIAMAAVGAEVTFSRRLEFELWRQANSIYLVSAPGGCDPVGIAVTLARRGLEVSIHVNRPGPYFLAGEGKPKVRDIMEEAQAAFAEEAAERGIRIEHTPLSRADLLSALDRGAVVISLISTHRMYRTRMPHWIVAYGHDNNYIFAHDPFVDTDEHEAPMDKAALAIPVEEFEHITAYGKERLRAAVIVEPEDEDMTWLILVDQERDFSNADTPHKVMTTRDYLSRPQLFRDGKPKIINLARSYGYQGAGYYCSLLAEARGHRIVPPVETMAELSRKTLYEQALPELEATLNRCLSKAAGPGSGGLKLFVCFGQILDPALVPFARLLFDWFRVPILRVSVNGQNSRRAIERIATASVNTLSDDERAFFARALDQHTRRTWRDPKARSQAKYSLAVLIDANEGHPPSNQASLRHLAKVAQKFSIDVEPIGKGDLDRLAEYDALFIRATTSIDNFTYRFARRAEQEGMPVIDDPRSMIRCTNKVYLAERLSAAGVPTPKTVVVQGLKHAASLGDELGWPVVLKIPDGSFSRGVFKCDSLDELNARLKEMLDHSDLVIAQEFVPTAFDWRIGVLAGEALFACQYHMVKKHWQIMQYKDGKTVGEGRFKTVALDEVPHGVVETAVRAARLMGQGFYGVDLKQTDSGLYVIEVNDNPDLNHGIEDVEEKDALWEKLVKWFWDRLEA